MVKGSNAVFITPGPLQRFLVEFPLLFGPRKADFKVRQVLGYIMGFGKVVWKTDYPFEHPIASLSYVLWNIKVTGKCALMADMAIGLDEYGDERSDFAHTRDALYILSVMNQFSIKRRMPVKEGEKLLRIALLSRALLVQPTDSVTRSLVNRRKLLARSLRERRKKGIVPVFISLGWFLFALSLSIADAFGQLGDNQTAHDLALGLLLAWLPIFVIATIVDRNPIGADSVRRKLNEFVEDVRKALLEPDLRKAFLNHYGRQEADLVWTRHLEDLDFYSSGFFSQFSGQGRVGWHYGVAHSITASMESAYIAAHGRNWLRVSWEAENLMIWAPVNDQGLGWFDFRMLWQIVSSIVVVGGTVFGAFILSCKSSDPLHSIGIGAPMQTPRESL
ncbi:MAG: hypothetical protein Q9186_004362 [Xanthomendoza sp. 1 TL-2023]